MCRAEASLGAAQPEQVARRSATIQPPAEQRHRLLKPFGTQIGLDQRLLEDLPLGVAAAHAVISPSTGSIGERGRIVAGGEGGG